METLKIPLAVIRIFFDTVTAAVIGTVSRPKQWSWKRHVKYSLLRSLIKHNFLKLIRRRIVTTTDNYYTYMKSQNAKAEVVQLEDSACGGWIGSSEAKKVLLYLHGGAYVAPINPGHLEMLGELVAKAKRQSKDLCVFVVEYGLAPKTVYPQQTIQAAHALRYLIDKVGYSPENIIIAGDSAGANLASSLLSILSHPLDGVPRIDLRGQKFAAAYFISPWVTFATGSRSMTINGQKDFLSEDWLNESSKGFMGGAEIDPYNTPLSASPVWWKGLPVTDLGVCGGEYEIFLDDIKAWVEKVKVCNPQLEFWVAPAEVHVQAVTDRELKLGISKSENHFHDWVLARV